MELEQYKKIFLNEAKDIIKSLNNEMVDLERDSSSAEVINAIFRGAHTLKGMSATMGYDPIVKLAHSAESVLALVRSHNLTINEEIMDLLFAAIDRLEEAVKAVGKDTLAKINVVDLVDKLNNISTCAGGEVKCQTVMQNVEIRLDKSGQDKMLAAKTKGLSTFKVDVQLASECKMMIARAMILLQQLGLTGEVVNFDLVVDTLKSVTNVQHFSFYYLTDKKENDLQKKIKNILEIDSVKFTTVDPAKEKVAEAKPTEAAAIHKYTAEDKPTVRISVEKLDKLMNIISELVISKIRLSDISRRLDNKELEETLAFFGRQSAELQAEMMEMRLFPLEYIFANFPRLVRDTAHNEHKEVDLIASGAEIGLDRTVLDEINEPLIHLLRNSVGHGIESPEEREAVSKNKRGKILLSASRERNFVIIEVRDDGRGMDPAFIKEKAIEKKIITAAEAAELSEEDALLLICHPNFSTSTATTETSGRGVGMNVVQEAAETLGGSISIESEKGKGSVFRLRLPLSVAIMQALLIQLDTEIYAIPLSSIAETIKFERSIIKKVGTNSEIINHRGQVLPLLRLRQAFGVTTPQAEPNIVSAVIIESGSKTVGLVIDQFIGQQEVVVKSLTDPLKQLIGISGATILGSGKVALIIDVVAVAK